jgi:hypothetical protein
MIGLTSDCHSCLSIYFFLVTLLVRTAKSWSLIFSWYHSKVLCFRYLMKFSFVILSVFRSSHTNFRNWYTFIFLLSRYFANQFSRLSICFLSFIFESGPSLMSKNTDSIPFLKTVPSSGCSSIPYTFSHQTLTFSSYLSVIKITVEHPIDLCSPIDNPTIHYL